MPDLPEHPLLQILARSLITNLALPALLTDTDGALLFFNEAAAQLIGRRFEEVGRTSREEWTRDFGPFDDEGRPIAEDSLPLAQTIRSGHPAQGRFRVQGADDRLTEVEVSALPLLEDERFEGALVLFWPVEDSANGRRG